MRRTILLLIALLPLLTGCGTYVGANRVAREMGPTARVSETPTRATIIAEGHEVVIESGASIVFIDGSPVMLSRPARMVNGRVEVPVEIYAHLPRPGTTATTFPPGDTTTTPDVPDRVPPKYCRIHTIVVDAGHGGTDLGAVYGGVQEKDINLDVAARVTAGLRARGMNVSMTRTGDKLLTLEERSAHANARGVDLFLSIHVNAAHNVYAGGVELFHLDRTFTHKGTAYDDNTRATELNRNRTRDRDLSRTGRTPAPVAGSDLAARRKAAAELAKRIDAALVRQLGTTSRGVKTAPFAVLKWTAAPSVLVEIGFLSNAAERAQLSTPAYRQKVAQAIVEGIQKYREECGTSF